MHARSRLRHLLRGVFAQWVRRRERRHPGAVYEAAITERVEQYETLRRAAAGVIYLRGKLDTQLRDARTQLEAAELRLGAALDRDDDAAGLPLVRRREALRAEVARLTAELEALTSEAEVAKQNLIAFGEEIGRLRDEKVRMLARLANARARVRLQRTLNGLSTDADVRALEAVREDIERQSHEAHLGHELGDLDGLRSAEADAVARAHWEELKRVRRGPLLPMIIPQNAA